jgi:hypothetical protein
MNPFVTGLADKQVVGVVVLPRLQIGVVSQVVNSSCCPVEATRLALIASRGK